MNEIENEIKSLLELTNIQIYNVSQLLSDNRTYSAVISVTEKHNYNFKL